MTTSDSHIASNRQHRLSDQVSANTTVLGKRRVPAFLQNLQQGLLDQSVDDAWHAELSDPAVRLGDFDPFDRLRPVGSSEQLRPNAGPVLGTDSRRSGLSVGTGQSTRPGCDRSKPPTNGDTERPAQCRPRSRAKARGEAPDRAAIGVK